MFMTCWFWQFSQKWSILCNSVLEKEKAGVCSASAAVVRNALSQFELPSPRFPLYITFESVRTEPNPLRVKFRQNESIFFYSGFLSFYYMKNGDQTKQKSWVQKSSHWFGNVSKTIGRTQLVVLRSTSEDVTWLPFQSARSTEYGLKFVILFRKIMILPITTAKYHEKVVESNQCRVRMILNISNIYIKLIFYLF